MTLFGRIKGWFKRRTSRKALTPADRHSRLVEIASERFMHTFVNVFVWYCQGGQVPGLEAVDERTLRRFFEQETNPQYWVALAQADPQEAYTQLQQWASARGEA